MKPDIATKKDIKDCSTKCYDLVMVDEKMCPFFVASIAQNHLEVHLESITDFWNDMLFEISTYKNNTTQKNTLIRMLL